MQTNIMKNRLLAYVSAFLLFAIGGNTAAKELRLVPCKELVRNLRTRRLEIEWKEVEND